MDVTIIIPTYKPDKELLKKVLKGVKEQNYEGKIEINILEGGGLANQLNQGIKKAKTEIIVTMHQDTIPYSKDWLRKLVAPLKDEKVIASSSKVELPYSLWKKFDIVSKLLSAKEEGVISPILDSKGDAYKKSALMKVGLFDDKNYKTAGEDCDMFLKLDEIGKIATPDAKVFHFHFFNKQKRLQKELQFANGFGTYVRINKFKIGTPYLIVGFIKALPFLGWPVFLFRFPYKKVKLLSILWIPLSLLTNFIYCVGFWKGFLSGKQNIYPDKK